MISGAEAHRIRRALESVADWTSEMIVVMNPEVNDGTDQIAAELHLSVKTVDKSIEVNTVPQ